MTAEILMTMRTILHGQSSSRNNRRERVWRRYGKARFIITESLQASLALLQQDRFIFGCLNNKFFKELLL